MSTEYYNGDPNGSAYSRGIAENRRLHLGGSYSSNKK